MSSLVWSLTLVLKFPAGFYNHSKAQALNYDPSKPAPVRVRDLMSVQDWLDAGPKDLVVDYAYGDAGGSPFEFTSDSCVDVYIADCCIPGDVYELKDNGVSLGFTDFSAGSLSSGIFHLGPGSHSLVITQTATVANPAG